MDNRTYGRTKRGMRPDGRTAERTRMSIRTRGLLIEGGDNGDNSNRSPPSPLNRDSCQLLFHSRMSFELSVEFLIKSRRDKLLSKIQRLLFRTLIDVDAETAHTNPRSEREKNRNQFCLNEFTTTSFYVRLREIMSSLKRAYMMTSIYKAAGRTEIEIERKLLL